MGRRFQIDVDELHMFAAYEWWDLGDPCRCGCGHRSTKVVGWGPTTVTYELVECCDCGCRAWLDGRYRVPSYREDRKGQFWLDAMDWRSRSAS